MTPTDMPLWGLARSAIRDILVAAGVATSASGIDLVLRWLTSFMAGPASDAVAQANLIAAGVGAGPV